VGGPISQTLSKADGRRGDLRVRWQPTAARPDTVWRVALLAAVWGLASHAAPLVGYAYPAGGQRGTTFRVEVGGQWLASVDGVRVSGQGVRASVVEYVPALDNEDLGRTGRFLRDLVRRRWSARAMQEAAGQTDEPPLPDHPWLRDLDDRTAGELARLRTRLFDPRKQPNAQIAEHLILAVSIAPEAIPGDRELRLESPEGLSNPLCFQVGVLPEVSEPAAVGGPAAGRVEPPALVNGQVAPGEVDRVSLRLRSGQKLVIRLQARRLIPYLADAVPGWFQATMALYDPAGQEVAWADDFRFDPDPVVLYEVPADGVYRLDVRDALYRGRDDFVYRIAVGQLPLVTQVFPLGGQEGLPAVATIQGWNLPAAALPLDTRPGLGSIRSLRVPSELGYADDVRYAVDALPEATEGEPNDGLDTAQEVSLPQIVNGRIGRPGDVDIFRFTGHAGQTIVADVYARRLGSPLDSVLRLVAADGTEVALNDDCKDPEMGLVTHHADSYIRMDLPRDGGYLAWIGDVQHQGGEPYTYRLRLRSAQPDFALRVTPSCLNLRPGQTAPVSVHVLCRDGFDGAVDLELAGAPEGFRLSETRVPAGGKPLETKLIAPRDAHRQVFPLRIEGRAEIAGATVRHAAVPAEDMMQAFLWRFLVPRQELLVAVPGSRPVPAVWRPRAPGFRLANTTPVSIPLGGTVRIVVAAPEVMPDADRTALASVGFRLAAQPRGITLRDATAGPGAVTLTLKADRNAAMAGDAANVIVEALAEPAGAAAAGADQVSAPAHRVRLGVLPPIPYVIVRP